MKVLIEKIDNGWLLKTEDGAYAYTYDDSRSEVGSFVELLRDIEDVFGPGDQSRYSKERIRINIEPGDKSM